jgi:hypothetical protein
MMIFDDVMMMMIFDDVMMMMIFDDVMMIVDPTSHHTHSQLIVLSTPPLLSSSSGRPIVCMQHGVGLSHSIDHPRQDHIRGE